VVLHRHFLKDKLEFLPELDHWMEFETGTSEIDIQSSTNVIIAVTTTVIMRSTIFLDAMPSSLVEVYRRFGDIYYLRFHGRRVSYKMLNLPLLIADLLLTS
jgi:hypothetical protein